ncbi:hypothetical protein EYF80_001980 [Liparis tanakae]|uniref:Uncharacterized protein n=1 Tax=Liparis tanakae TaxID=230148 RepID=A0A4Z2JCX1_9TELE|nr:hypothetical protein EYF80_001980 [Liparis tanakae]
MGRQAAQEDSHFRPASVAVNASRQRRADTRPRPTVPLWPLAPRLAGSPASGRHTTRSIYPHPYPHPHPRSGPIDTALRLSSDQSFGGAALPEENPIQHSLSGLSNSFR